MSKYIILVIIFMLIILLLIWFNKITLNMFEGASIPDSITVNNQDAIPMTVIITPENDFYHKKECVYIGRNAKEIRIDKAKQEGYEPCPYCFRKDSTANESN